MKLAEEFPIGGFTHELQRRRFPDAVDVRRLFMVPSRYRTIDDQSPTEDVT